MFALVKNQTVIDPQTQESSEVEVIKVFNPYSVWQDKNGTQYGPDRLLELTSDEKQDLGIYDVAYGTRQDDRFYIVTENAPEFDAQEKVVKITFTSVAKDLNDSGTEDFPILGLKSQYINQFKGVANSLLSATDWTLVRKIERNIDVPASIATYRAAVVAEANRLETAIAAATTVEELIAAVDSALFPSAQ